MGLFRSMSAENKMCYMAGLLHIKGKVVTGISQNDDENLLTDVLYPVE